VPYREHVPPDVTACIFWLKNRDPAHWRDAWQLEHIMGKYIAAREGLDDDQAATAAWARRWQSARLIGGCCGRGYLGLFGVRRHGK
jgi:hypothetical protein